MTIVYDQQPSGQCPVQAEGTINGRKFCFRGLGEWMGLLISENQIYDEDSLTYSERYEGVNKDRRGGAGYAEPQECMDFIVRAAKILLKEDKQ